MANKTQPIKVLLEDVLSTMKPPYSENITDEVCLAIAQNRQWKARYDALVKQLSHDPVNNSPDVVNNWIGRYLSIILGRKSGDSLKASVGSIIKSYKKLPS